MLDQIEDTMNIDIPLSSQSTEAGLMLSTQEVNPETQQSLSPVKEISLVPTAPDEQPLITTEHQTCELQDSTTQIDLYSSIIPSPFTPVDLSSRTDLFRLSSSFVTSNSHSPAHDEINSNIIAHLNVITLPSKYDKGSSFGYPLIRRFLVDFKFPSKDNDSSIKRMNWVNGKEYGPYATPRLPNVSPTERSPLSLIYLSNRRSEEGTECQTKGVEKRLNEWTKWKVPTTWDGKWQSPWGDILPPSENSSLESSTSLLSGEESTSEGSRSSGDRMEIGQDSTKNNLDDEGVVKVDMRIDGSIIRIQFLEGRLEAVEFLEPWEIESVMIMADQNLSTARSGVSSENQVVHDVGMEIAVPGSAILSGKNRTISNQPTDEAPPHPTIPQNGDIGTSLLPKLIVDLFYQSSILSLLSPSKGRRLEIGCSSYGNSGSRSLCFLIKVLISCP